MIILQDGPTETVIADETILLALLQVLPGPLVAQALEIAKKLQAQMPTPKLQATRVVPGSVMPPPNGGLIHGG